MRFFPSRIVSWKRFPIFPYAILLSQILFLVAGTFTRSVTVILPKLSSSFILNRSPYTRLGYLVTCIYTVLVVHSFSTSELFYRNQESTTPLSNRDLFTYWKSSYLNPYFLLMSSFLLYILPSFSYPRRRDVLIFKSSFLLHIYKVGVHLLLLQASI